MNTALTQTPECPYCGKTDGLRVACDGGGYIAPEYTCAVCWNGGDTGPCFDDLPEVKRAAPALKPVREDYIVRYSDKRSTMVEEFLSATHDTVQAWILAELNPGQLLEVRKTTLDEYARKVTEVFREAGDDDAKRLELTAA